MSQLIVCFLGVVGEEDEVSIKQVADAIVKAVGFEGDYSVLHLLFSHLSLEQELGADNLLSIFFFFLVLV
jgi:hypothetical protein